MIYYYYYTGPTLSNINDELRKYYIAENINLVYKYIKLLNYNDILTNIFSLHKFTIINEFSYNNMSTYNIHFNKIQLITNDKINALYDDILYKINKDYHDSKTEYCEMIARECTKLDKHYNNTIDFINTI
jgi:hypothetical protein